MNLYVNRLSSLKTLIPYDYNKFDFCGASDDSYYPNVNLGQLLLGDRIRPSPYNIKFLENETCKVTCKKVYNGSDPESVRRLMFLKKGLHLNYRHNWIVDDIPVIMNYRYRHNENIEERHEYSKYFHIKYQLSGFPVGFKSCSSHPTYNNSGAYYLFNHFDLVITYNNIEHDMFQPRFVSRIVLVEVIPSSIRHDTDKPDCTSKEQLEISETPLEAGKTFEIVYTYSVSFVQSNSITWNSRWDKILELTNVSAINIMTSPIATCITMIAALLCSYRRFNCFFSEMNIMFDVDRAEEESSKLIKLVTI